MASVRDLPRSDCWLIARIRSPIWRAPVLQTEDLKIIIPFSAAVATDKVSPENTEKKFILLPIQHQLHLQTGYW